MLVEIVLDIIYWIGCTYNPDIDTGMAY